MVRRTAGGRRSGPDGPTGDVADDAEADPRAVARTICLRLLTVRSRTRAELSDALVQRNVEASIVDEVLDRFTEVGLIDDAAFAESFVTQRQSGRGLALREVRRQLQDKGVSAEVTASAIATAAVDERDTAVDLARRKMRSLRSLDDEVATRRLVGMLARKGYSPSITYGVVREVIGEHAAERLGDAD